ncbi:MAG: hypothetical protein K2P99_02285, partial [Burkholderiales bacterium]|nr:hypothetical protein [Burkholderiales bacterium]
YIKGLQILTIDWSLVGSWVSALGTIGTGCILAVLSHKQNKINNRIANHEIFKIYYNHWIKLSSVLNQILDINLREILEHLYSQDTDRIKYEIRNEQYRTIFSEAEKLYNESRLFKSNKIKDEVYKSISVVRQLSVRILYCKMAYDESETKLIFLNLLTNLDQLLNKELLLGYISELDKLLVA